MKNKKIIYGIVGIFIIVGGSGYHMYNRFIKNTKFGASPGVVEQVVSPVKQVKGINLEKAQLNAETVKSFASFFNEFKDKLSDEKLYDKSKNSYLENLKSYLSLDYYHSIENNKADNIFTGVLNDVTSKPNRHIESITLVGLGKAIYSDKEVYKAIIDINSMDDDIGFHIQRLNVYIGDDKRILKATKEGSMFDQANTTTPLTIQSIVNVNSNNEFVSELNHIIKEMKNKNLYNKVKDGTLKVDSPEWKSFASNLNIKEPDVVVLFDMFKQGKGELKSWGIVEQENKDIDVTAITTYIMKVADEKEIGSYSIDFKRANNKILKISKVK